MKNAIIIILINLCFSACAQDFKDRIITLDNDTLNCQITLVNDDNIFYNVKVNKNIENKYLPLKAINKYILDINSKPEIISSSSVKQNIDSLDYIGKEKILVIESSKFTGWQRPPTRAFFHTGDNVKIKRYNNDTIIKGNLEHIADSSIIVDGRQIKTNEIQRISAATNRGVAVTTIGLSTVTLSAGMIATSTLVYPEKYNNEDEDVNGWSRFYYEVGFGCLGFTGGIIAFVGIIDMATVKHYRMDKKWKIYTSN